MNICSRLSLLAVAGVMSLSVAVSVVPQTARAITSNAVARDVQYSVTFHAQNSVKIPFTGTMRLNFNKGYITGWYNDNSIRPGSPFGTKPVSVMGGTSNGQIHLTIRNITINGTLQGQWIRGSALLRSVIFIFAAQQH